MAGVSRNVACCRILNMTTSGLYLNVFHAELQRAGNAATGTFMGKTKQRGAPSVFAGKAWQQVLARDARADGQFVYAVKSTGIYCKPSCPSRRPERKNVSFFPHASAAEAAG